MYLLIFSCSERTHHAGLFHTTADIKSWLSCIPFVRSAEGDYEINYGDLPEYYEVDWQGSRFPLTRYMFTGDVSIYWEELCIVENVAGMLPGATLVDNYYIDNEELPDYIKARDALRAELIAYFEVRGDRYYSGGAMSEDGEYLGVPDQLFIHLDPQTIAHRQRVQHFEDFISSYR